MRREIVRYTQAFLLMYSHFILILQVYLFSYLLDICNHMRSTQSE